jgi:uncharacterized membrane protein YdbT with pleckstrin-like domain
MQQEAVKCDYFSWRDPEMCVYGLKVVSRLRKWHESLKLERELSGTQVSDEADKYKSEAERNKNEADKCREEAEKYKSKLERQKMKLRSVERKYKFAFVCSWVIFVLLLVYPQSHSQCNASRMMLA